jgi:hypothetical protein
MSDIKLTETQEALQRFLDDVIKKSKANLSSKGINASNGLSNSFSSSLKVSKNSFEATILSDEHGKFIDKGVTGNNDSSFKGKKKPIRRSLSGFRFGTGNFNGKGEEWKKRIDKWMYTRGIAPRDKKTGKFIKRDTANYLIRRSIFQHGIKPTKFFTDPFEEEFNNLPNDLIEAYGLDVEKFIKFILKE